MYAMANEMVGPVMNVTWRIRDYPPASPPETFGPFADFLRLWQSKDKDAKHDGRILPAWKDFDLSDLRPWWGQITLMEREDDTGRFRILLWGTKVTEWYGKDLTNHYLDDAFKNAPKRKEKGEDHLGLFFLGGVIAFWKEIPTHFDRDYAFIEGLSVPLSRNGETTTHMMTLKIRTEQDGGFWPAIPHVAEF